MNDLNYDVFQNEESNYYFSESTGYLPNEIPTVGIKGMSAVYSKQSKMNKKKSESPSTKIKKESIKLVCSICQVTCDGQKQYGEHLNGQKHKKKAEIVERMSKSENVINVPMSDSFQQKQEQLKLLLQTEKEQDLLKLKKQKSMADQNQETEQQNSVNLSEEQKKQEILKQKMQVELQQPVPQKQQQQQQLVASNDLFHCSLCQISCNNSEPFKLHLAGAKHQKNLAKYQNDPAKISESSNFIVTSKTSDDTTESTDNADAHKKVIDEVFSQLLGSEYLKELVNDKGTIVTYKCELCSVTLPDVNHARAHMEGRKHKVNYKKKVDSSITLPPKHLKKTQNLMEMKAQKRKMKEDFWKQKDMMMMMTPFDCPSMVNAMQNVKGSAYNIRDAYIHKKCLDSQIQPEKLQYLLAFVDYCELALQDVSDVMMHEEHQKSQQQQNVDDIKTTTTTTSMVVDDDKNKDSTAISNNTTTTTMPEIVDDDVEKYRMLQGTMRVGLLCTGLMLDSDDKFDIVVLSSAKPTVEMLHNIYKWLPGSLKKVLEKFRPTTEYQEPQQEQQQQEQQQEQQQQQIMYDHDIHMIEDDAQIIVQTTDAYSFYITIHLTSMLYEEEEREKKGELDVNMKDDQDCHDDDKEALLNKEPCLSSLRAVRRAKWFQVRAMSLFEGLKVMKVMKQLKVECKDLAPLSDWALEVLIEKSSFLEGVRASPSEILRCFLQILSYGILLDDMGLQDPCEIIPSNVFNNLETQQKEDLTKYAHTSLRQLTFERLHLMLNMPALPRKGGNILNVKKMKSNDDDNVVEIMTD